MKKVMVLCLAACVVAVMAAAVSRAEDEQQQPAAKVTLTGKLTKEVKLQQMPGASLDSPAKEVTTYFLTVAGGDKKITLTPGEDANDRRMDLAPFVDKAVKVTAFQTRGYTVVTAIEEVKQ